MDTSNSTVNTQGDQPCSVCGTPSISIMMACGRADCPAKCKRSRARAQTTLEAAAERSSMLRPHARQVVKAMMQLISAVAIFTAILSGCDSTCDRSISTQSCCRATGPGKTACDV